MTLHRRVAKSELGLLEDDVILLPYQQAALQTAAMNSDADARK